MPFLDTSEAMFSPTSASLLDSSNDTGTSKWKSEDSDLAGVSGCSGGSGDSNGLGFCSVFLGRPLRLLAGGSICSSVVCGDSVWGCLAVDGTSWVVFLGLPLFLLEAGAGSPSPPSLSLGVGLSPGSNEGSSASEVVASGTGCFLGLPLPLLTLLLAAAALGFRFVSTGSDGGFFLGRPRPRFGASGSFAGFGRASGFFLGRPLPRFAGGLFASTGTFVVRPLLAGGGAEFVSMSGSHVASPSVGADEPESDADSTAGETAGEPSCAIFRETPRMPRGRRGRGVGDVSYYIYVYIYKQMH